jgi:protein O-GlcNAc transferase
MPHNFGQSPKEVPSYGVKLKQAVELHQRGKLDEAEILYQSVLKMMPKQFDALHLLGVIATQRGRHDAAVTLIGEALKYNSQSATAFSNIGFALDALNRHKEAIVSFDRALALKPDYAEAYNNRGNALASLNRHKESLISFDRALALKPDYAEAYYNRGNSLHDLKAYEEAIESFDRALALKPGYPEAFYNRGNCLYRLKRYRDAVSSFDRALALKPGYAKALCNRGNALHDLNRYEEALASFEQVLALDPNHFDALSNRGSALMTMQRYGEAIKDFERLLSIDPDYKYARGKLLHSRMRHCDWTSFDQQRSRIQSEVHAGKLSIMPFELIGVTESAGDQLLCSQILVKDKYPLSSTPLWQGERYKHDKIRIAYLSADFRDHATSYLLAGLFEQHDSERFETVAVSFGPAIPSNMRTRLEAAFRQFIDVRRANDRAISSLLRELEIDIAVDLMGYTKDCRPEILASRPAPIQVNYLGYPGTMGADFIDYILADRFVIPDNQRQSYSESVVYLPDTYAANDSKRRIADQTPTRAEVGLPETGFVFCSFNNSYKITPYVFDIWMRLLGNVEGSVLWLLATNTSAVENLRREAEARGIQSDRLVFAPRVKLEDHLARHRLADLFLDTLPCNAHTTASDALWAGLPLVTCLGSTFAGRVAGSLLNAIGLQELITRALTDYEALALRLAQDRDALAAIKATLAQNRYSYPLFNTSRFRRHIEAAYVTMWQRYQAGEPPVDFAVEPIKE